MRCIAGRVRRGSLLQTKPPSTATTPRSTSSRALGFTQLVGLHACADRRRQGRGTRATSWTRAGERRRLLRAGAWWCAREPRPSAPSASIATRRVTRSGTDAARMLPMPAPMECPSTAKRSQPSASATSSTAFTVTGEVVVGAWPQVRAAPMSGQVQHHQVQARRVPGTKLRCQRQEAGRVVQPAMQGQHLRPFRRTAAQAGDATERDFEADFVHAHAPVCSARRASATSASACAAESLRQGM